MNQYEKAMAIVNKYTWAGVPLTEAEKKLLAHLKAKYNK
jgi:hypothetical protein